MRNCQPGAYYAGAGRRVAEADLRHISVSDHPTTDIRETCTYIIAVHIKMKTLFVVKDFAQKQFFYFGDLWRLNR